MLTKIKPIYLALFFIQRHKVVLLREIRNYELFNIFSRLTTLLINDISSTYHKNALSPFYDLIHDHKSSHTQNRLYQPNM